MKQRLHGAIVALGLFQYALAQATNSSAVLEELQKALPSCALQCTLTEVPKSTCALTDISCICTNEALNNEILVCLQQSCTVVEQLQTKKVFNGACGVPVRNVGSHLSAINWTFFGLATLAVGCRLLARLKYFGGNFAWDDYTIGISLLCLTPIAVIAQLMVDHGLGQDIWQLEAHDISKTLLYFYIEEFLYVFLSSVTKLSILLLYLQIFKTKSFQIRCYVVIALIVGYLLGGTISTGLYCRPLNYVWEGWDGLHPAKCVNINAQTFAMAGVNMALDIAIFILPIPPIMRLHMTMRKRIAVSGVFATGLFVTACSVVRLTTLLKWGKSQNPTYDYTEVAIWSLIELMTAVICACMPGIASLIRRVWPRAFGTTKGNSYMNSEPFSSNLDQKMQSSKNIQSRTIISVSFASRDAAMKDEHSDEFELTPGPGFRHQGNYTRYSEES
ncbi:uncharacterized protein PV09_01901 [Verruconis gallopava]|uniref:CFEM domain-containing protein n=1 Tax=Verruconis gallopava TaxID=253628 RepID=A0A0D1XWA9_9PEZI|nr:uncharacterized protein PV09_01901 [Verruconis gallopava]KIW07006.1 hypothetical protein PV09_01901 [Verruconis gallopava]